MEGEGRSLLVDVAIILAASFPLLFLGKRLKVPEVIAYLATGIVIGPHALGWIRDTHSVEQIAELGVALILFFIGLEIPFDKLRTLGRTTLLSGSLQIAFTVLVVIVVGLFFRSDVRQSAFYGLLVALGSTAVVLPILATRDEMGAPFARRFLGVSLFQDFAVIPLMLLVPAFASGAGAPPLPKVFLRVGIAIAGVVLLILIARVIVPRLFRRIAALGSREVFTAGVIVLIVATIAAAGRLGISAALGAFAAGVVVGDTEFIHEISGVLRPFRDFLSVLFFASIGMLLDPAFVVAALPLVLATVGAVVLIKVVAAYPAFRSSGALPRTSLRAAFAIAPIGEFSFLLAQEGKRFGVLQPEDEQLFVATAVITLGATPVLVALGRKLAERMRGRPEPAEGETERELSGHIVVIGYGLNGLNVAHVLTETGVPHVVVEEDPHRAEIARQNGSRVVVADAGDPSGLEAAGIQRALAAVIAISDPDGTRRIVRVCRRENPKLHIIVRTRYISQVEALRELGADEVIPEEFETSVEIVSRLMRLLAVPANVVAAQIRILRDEAYRILRDPAGRAAEGRRLSAMLEAGTSLTFFVLPDTPALGKTLADLGVADARVAVPAMIRRGAPYSPAPTDEPLQAGDTLFLVGAHEDLMTVTARLEGRRGP
ncbi:MAG TPA: cation:proton antiporter [Thermoanaerobaculia bacterium]|nr:cation:proton antiporter [Thermoanaerobaculia bacterium]